LVTRVGPVVRPRVACSKARRVLRLDLGKQPVSQAGRIDVPVTSSVESYDHRCQAASAPSDRIACGERVILDATGADFKHQQAWNPKSFSSEKKMLI
jgi:hypothetical protein